VSRTRDLVDRDVHVLNDLGVTQVCYSQADRHYASFTMPYVARLNAHVSGVTRFFHRGFVAPTHLPTPPLPLLEVGPSNAVRGSGGLCKLTERVRAEPGHKIFWCILS